MAGCGRTQINDPRWLIEAFAVALPSCNGAGWTGCLHPISLALYVLSLYSGSMQVKWDPNKAKQNLRDHGVRFADAEGVFEDEYALYYEDLSAQGQQRHLRIGMDFLGRVLVAVYTYGPDHIQLISARKATRRERVSYEQRRPEC